MFWQASLTGSVRACGLMSRYIMRKKDRFARCGLRTQTWTNMSPAGLARRDVWRAQSFVAPQPCDSRRSLHDKKSRHLAFSTMYRAPASTRKDVARELFLFGSRPNAEVSDSPLFARLSDRSSACPPVRPTDCPIARSSCQPSVRPPVRPTGRASGVGSGSGWCHYGIDVGSVWVSLQWSLADMGPSWGRVGVALMQGWVGVRGQVGVDAGSIWGQVRVELSLIRGRVGVESGSMWGRLDLEST